MEPADIAIIIVHWNVPDLLAECLASIKREVSCVDLRTETLVIDSASSNQQHRDVVARFPEVRLVESRENLGYSAGNNLGIRETCSQAVLILNPDTMLLPGSLTTLWQTLNVAPHVGLVAPLLLNPDRSIQSAGYDFPGIRNLVCDLFPAPARIYASRFNGRHDGGDGVLPYQIDYPLGAAMMLRRSALAEVGGFDEDYQLYCEEIELCQQMAARKWTQLLAPSARVVHFGGQSTGQVRHESQMALWKSRMRYYQRWRHGRSKWATDTLLRLGLRRAREMAGR